VLGISYHTLQTYLQYRLDDQDAGPDGTTKLPGVTDDGDPEPEEGTAALG
jgi:hypothetical protein